MNQKGHQSAAFECFALMPFYDIVSFTAATAITGYRNSSVSFCNTALLLIRATPHNSARSLSQNFCPNSKFRKWRNTVCISHFWNCGSGVKRRLRLEDAIVRCCLSVFFSAPLANQKETRYNMTGRTKLVIFKEAWAWLLPITRLSSSARRC